MDKTINAAIDRATEQLEMSRETAPETTSAWAQVLAGLEVVIDYDRRIELLEERMTRLDELWAYHECDGRPEWVCDVHR